ncbi:hypothetical protein ACJX0J_023332 [Zea mays]
MHVLNGDFGVTTDYLLGMWLFEQQLCCTSDGFIQYSISLIGTLSVAHSITLEWYTTITATIRGIDKHVIDSTVWKKKRTYSCRHLHNSTVSLDISLKDIYGHMHMMNTMTNTCLTKTPRT